MIVSLHLPKTAGSSFRESLRGYYGKQLIEDYADRPLSQSLFSRRSRAVGFALFNPVRDYSSIACIHGHFLPLKYLFTPLQVDFVTWLRDPVERLASHYYYWRNDRSVTNPPRFRRRVLEEDWSLRKFCFARELQNLYSEFLWGVSLEDFSFVGITEEFETDFNEFNDLYLGGCGEMALVNVNAERKQESNYIKDAGLRREVEAFHALDMSLYERALEMRDCRQK